MIPNIIGITFTSAELKLAIDKCIDSIPSDKPIHTSVTNNTIDTILLNQQSIIENLYVYLSVDKGNKKGNKNLARFLCWYDEDTKKIRNFLIDMNCTDESTAEIVEGIIHSLKKFTPSIRVILFEGQCTDSGGDGMKYVLQRELTTRQMVTKGYLIGTCTLHNFQTGLHNAAMHILGEGGTNEKGEFRMNAM